MTKDIDLNPDLKRLRDIFHEQVRLLFQGYLDEAGTESNGFIEGLDITHDQAAEFVNDVLLYGRDGESLPDKLKVYCPVCGPSDNDQVCDPRT
jgi:hypothetical protein